MKTVPHATSCLLAEQRRREESHLVVGLVDKHDSVVRVFARLHVLESLDITLGADLWGLGKDR